MSSPSLLLLGERGGNLACRGVHFRRADDTVADTERHLFRGFMVWNSEVGHHRFGVMTFLYDFVCDNRMVHGAREVKELSIRHTKRAPQRFAELARPALRAYADAGVREIEAELHRATETVVGKGDKEVRIPAKPATHSDRRRPPCRSVATTRAHG
jgi:hypothetical protein